MGCHELTPHNVLEGIDNNSWRAVDLDDLRRAIRIAGVVDEARNAALLRRVDNLVICHAEQITRTDALFVVADLTHIRDLLADFLADILDDELVYSNVLVGI
jgi:hypothetical protein